MKKLAFISEPRKHKALGYVLENFLTMLPDDWNIQINYGLNNLEYIKKVIKNSKVISSANSKDRIILKNLNVDNLTHREESDLLRTVEFYNNLKGDILLKFECDTILCPNSKHKIDDFLHFKYIGGYWGNKLYPLNKPYPTLKPGGAYAPAYGGPQTLPLNGGLSLRNKSTIINIIQTYFKEYVKSEKTYSEDYFFTEYIGNRPLTKEVISFSIDNGYITPLNGEAPFGLHKPWVNKGNAYSAIKEICPEVTILESLQQIEN